MALIHLIHRDQHKDKGSLVYLFIMSHSTVFTTKRDVGMLFVCFHTLHLLVQNCILQGLS